MTNPDNALGTNGAFGGRTSVNAFNDVLATFDGAGIVSGFVVEPDTGMTVAVGGDGTTRDVAVAEDPFGNRTTVDNISGDPIPVTIDTASTTTARIDSIVAYVNSPANASTTDVDNPTACGIIAVNGTSGGAPLDAAIRTAITADGGTGSTAYYVVIANVSVPANTTTITSGLISAGKSVNLSDVATTGSNGLMSGADKTALNNLSTTVTGMTTISYGSGTAETGVNGTVDYIKYGRFVFLLIDNLAGNGAQLERTKTLFTNLPPAQQGQNNAAVLFTVTPAATSAAVNNPAVRLKINADGSLQAWYSYIQAFGSDYAINTCLIYLAQS